MLTSPSHDQCSASGAQGPARQLLQRAARLSALLRVSAAGLAHGPTLDDRLSALGCPA